MSLVRWGAAAALTSAVGGYFVVVQGAAKKKKQQELEMELMLNSYIPADSATGGGGAAAAASAAGPDLLADWDPMAGGVSSPSPAAGLAAPPAARLSAPPATIASHHAKLQPESRKNPTDHHPFMPPAPTVQRDVWEDFEGAHEATQRLLDRLVQAAERLGCIGREAQQLRR